MATYNGVRFLREQLDTIAAQSLGPIDLWVSDDGSTDGTRQLLEDYSKAWTKGTMHVLDGPRAGFAENFRSLIQNDGIRAEFFAFSDQDDLWHARKIEIAIGWLAELDPVTPALYGGRTNTVDVNGARIGQSPLFTKAPSFRNALVQSIAGGNTMVMNRAARDLIASASRTTSFVTHDWWSYQIVTGAGGTFRYDPEATIDYRQHGGNLVGQNADWAARIHRLRELLKGKFSRWNEQNIDGLALNAKLLTIEAKRALAEFRAARSGNIVARLVHLHRAGVYRQTIAGQLGLYVACLFNKL